jgi:hypothetical protein
MNLNKPTSDAGLSATRRTHRKPCSAETLNVGVRHFPDVGTGTGYGSVLPNGGEAFRKGGMRSEENVSTEQLALEQMASSGRLACQAPAVAPQELWTGQ